jgi:hypothetical protein
LPLFSYPYHPLLQPETHSPNIGDNWLDLYLGA